MKKLSRIIAALAIVAMLAVPAMGADLKMWVHKTHAAVSVVAGGSSTSSTIDLSSLRPHGYFTIQWTLTGTGTAKFEYLTSIDGVNFAEPSGASDIAAGKTAGTDIVSFTPVVAPYLQIKVTETGAATGVVATVYLCVQ